MNDDSLAKTLLLLESHRIRWTYLRVGDVQIHRTPDAQEQVAATQTRSLADAERLELDKLRIQARQLFGRTPPDEELKEMRGAL